VNKISIIIAREFGTRVRKKSFLVVTLLVPVLFLLFYAFVTWILLRDDNQQRHIAVINQSTLDQPLKPLQNTRFTYLDDIPPAAYPTLLRDNQYNAIVRLPAHLADSAEITVHSLTQLPVELKNTLAAQVRQEIEKIKRDELVTRLRVPDLERQLDATRSPVTVRTLVLTANGDSREGSSEITSILGMITGFIIYMFIFMYASQVMRGVIEEKTNRVIEILVSSVKPFQFLIGKIIGVAAVGLLQFLVWIAFGAIVITAARATLAPGLDLDALRQSTDLAGMAATSGIQAEQLGILQNLLRTIDPSFIFGFLGLFLFYFLGGYLLYASLFAALGAACDSETDTQQFMMPLTIILMVGLYIGMAAMKNPETPLAFWASLVPFTSPIVMLVRAPFGVAGWEIALSMALLIAAFLFFTWCSAKIYRVGILMYGKKTTWRELYKWLRY
jgi:ABC-2 type transport system permease protein